MRGLVAASCLVAAFVVQAASAAPAAAAQAGPPASEASAPGSGLERLDGAVTLAELNDQADVWATEGFDDPEL